MYDNRQNNRFSIFIGAIVVSLLVLITGCSSAQKEINTGEPITEDSSNPVTLTVYLTAHYANPDTHCPIYEKLLDYQKENPNITIQFVSPKEGDTAEREAEIHQLNTEILSGKGPDLFIMEGNRLTNVNLFPDIEKSMMNGAFLDLTDVMDSNEFTTENFYMPLLDAGKLKGKQYILPLCFSVPTLTSAESVLKDSGFDMQAASKSLAATMDELLRIYKEKPMLMSLLIDLLRGSNCTLMNKNEKESSERYTSSAGTYCRIFLLSVSNSDCFLEKSLSRNRNRFCRHTKLCRSF